jgi:hypothetical protein
MHCTIKRAHSITLVGAAEQCWRHLSSSTNELQQQSTDFLRLLLLYPMSRAINQISTALSGTGDGLHSLERARILVDAPVAFAGNETGRRIDGAARKHFKL